MGTDVVCPPPPPSPALGRGIWGGSSSTAGTRVDTGLVPTLLAETPARAELARPVAPPQAPRVCLSPPPPSPAGKVVYAETTTAHATLTGLHYYHQDWFHAAAYVTVPPLRLDTNTSAYLMSLLAK